MRSRVVAVRCFAEESAQGWEAHCVDLGVSVRGESLESVKTQLDTLIHELIDDTLVTRRRASRAAPSGPRGPLALRLRYWGLRLAGRLGLRSDVLQRRESRGARSYEPRVATRTSR